MELKGLQLRDSIAQFGSLAQLENLPYSCEYVTTLWAVTRAGAARPIPRMLNSKRRRSEQVLGWLDSALGLGRRLRIMLCIWWKRNGILCRTTAMFLGREENDGELDVE